MTSRSWVFTLNNPQPEEDPKGWTERVAWCTWQREKGENGTEHLQGYLQLHRKGRISVLKKVNARAHWEARRGTHEEALAYVSKEESRVDGPWSYGTPTRQGERTDVLAFLEAAATVTEYQLALKYPDAWVKYWRAAERFRRLSRPPRDFKTECTVLYGAPGSGKSSYCATHFQDAYWKPKGEWWDGYANEEVVVIDEFYGWLPFDLLCRILDRYPLMVPTKGGFLTFTSKKVLITSNKHPREWYDPGRITWGALARRIEKCYFYSGEAPPVLEDVNNPLPVYRPGSGANPPTVTPFPAALVRAGAILGSIRTNDLSSGEAFSPQLFFQP